MKDTKHMMEVFTEYEKKFGEWLYSAWDFDSVDWDGLVQAAEKSIQDNKPMSDEEKQKFFGEYEDDKVY